MGSVARARVTRLLEQRINLGVDVFVIFFSGGSYVTLHRAKYWQKGRVWLMSGVEFKYKFNINVINPQESAKIYKCTWG